MRHVLSTELETEAQIFSNFTIFVVILLHTVTDCVLFSQLVQGFYGGPMLTSGVTLAMM